MTAQEAFKLMLREHVAPVLRGLGFKGPASAGRFLRESGDYAMEVQFRKSRYSTRKTVEYWVELSAWRIPTVPKWQPFWQGSFGSLVPRWEHPSGTWTIDAHGPPRHNAALVLWAFRTYGWPALLAAVEADQYVPGPPIVRPRELPADLVRSPYLNVWALARERMATVESPAELRAIDERPLHDPEERQALLRALELQEPIMRRFAVARLDLLADAEDVRTALQKAAEDEDFEVRWTARYALKRAGYDAARGSATRVASSS
jgi:hypothetical protein